MRVAKNFHHYERRHQILKHRIWPEKYEYPLIQTNQTIRTNRTKYFKLTQRNKEILHEYLQALDNANYGLARVNRLLAWLADLGEMLEKDFDQATKEDIQGTNGLLSKINNRWKNDLTREGAYICLKQFYRWLHSGKVKGGDLPLSLQGIVFQKKRSVAYGKELFTKSEINHLIDSAKAPLTKAIISCLYFSGARISELGLSRVGDFKFNGTNECSFNIRYSKSEPRTTLIMGKGALILQEWLEKYHPHRKQEGFQDSPAFASLQRRKGVIGYQLGYNAIRKHLMTAAKEAGINKPANPHHFRHCFGTHLAEEGYSLPEIGLMLGHRDLKSTQVYLNPSMHGVHDKMRQKYHGKEIPREDVDVFRIRSSLQERDRITDLERQMKLLTALLEKGINPQTASGEELRRFFEEMRKKEAKLDELF